MTVKDSIKETAERASDAVGETYRSARSQAAEMYDTAAAKTSELYDGARERVGEAGHKAAGAVDKNPLSALFGGLAIGAFFGALLPRTRKEEELLGPYGRDINDRARGAANAVKEVGREKLDEFGFVKDEARNTAERLIDTTKSVAKEAGSAAAEGARKRD